MYTSWMHEWLDNELTDDQRRKRTAAQSSIFRNWLFQNMGGKYFVMAIWQTDITWAPSTELLNSDFKGALEHVAQHVAS